MKHNLLLLPPAKPDTSPVTPAAPAGDPRLQLLEQRVAQLETACRQAEHALEVSNQRARILFECVPDPCYLCTFEGVFVNGNRATEAMSGYSRAELIGKNLFHLNLLTPEGLAQAAATLAANRQGQATGPTEYTIRRKDGTTVIAEIRAHPVRLGDQVLVLGTARDVTQRKRAQEALSESEANYRLLVERSPDAVFIHVEEKFVYANPAALRLLGASQPEQVLGRSIWDIVPADYRDLIQRRVRQFSQQEGNPMLEQRILRLDGSAVEVEAMSIPFCYQGQRAVQTIMHDISARKRADEQILNQARLLEVAQDAITVQDMSGRIHFWNSGASRLYGWSLEEALERDSDGLLASVTAPTLAEVRRQVLEHGEWAGELRQRTKDQREITVLSRWTLVRHPDGSPRSLLAVSTDITEKTRLEAQLMRAQRLESIGRLASGIAHDLNNVLTPVMMAVQLLDPSCRDESEREILQTLETCAKRGAGIVQQVLLFARGTEGSRVLLHPKHQLQEMAQIVRETFPKSITLQTAFERGLWPIRADHTQMQQVLMNLCVNARDAMPHGGVLKLQVANRELTQPQPALHPKALPGRYVLLSVADTGSGIPPEILNKIFDPFFTTKPAGQGTGLGLPTTLGIVESHGGFISVTSQPGVGTEFNVYLPAADAPEVAAPLPAAALQPRGHGELLLVVDDELAIRELVRNTLESFGYRVLSAAGGEEALSQYRQHRAELHAVILDLMMPGLAWKSIVEGLRQLNPQVRIITISGLSTDLTALKAKVPGIAAVLPKPFTPSELLHTIATLPAHPA